MPIIHAVELNGKLRGLESETYNFGTNILADTLTRYSHCGILLKAGVQFHLTEIMYRD